jgi:tetratricopeptide (TPR) repeat protein
MLGYLWKGEMEQAIALKEEVLRGLHDKLGEWFNLRRAQAAFWYASIGHTWLGRWDDAMKEGMEALKLGQEYSEDGLISMAAMQLCIVCNRKGDLDHAIEYGRMGVEKAPTPLDTLQSRLVLAWAMCRLGEPKGNVEILAEVVQLIRDAGAVHLYITFMPLLGEAYMLAGQYDMARQTTQQVVELAERHGAMYFLGLAYRLLGEVALKTNPSEAAPHFEKAIQINQEIKAENDLALAYSGMGRLHKTPGSVVQARECLTKALEIFERLGTLIEPDKVREELGELGVV